MKVLFFEIDTENTWAVASIGAAYLAAYLREQGHQVEGLRIGPQMTTEEILQEVNHRDPGLIGMSLTSRQWMRGRQVAEGIRKSSTVPIIAGGLHPTFSPEQVLECTAFDYVCLGEGELALTELVDRLDASRDPDAGSYGDEIENIWVRSRPRPRLRSPFSPIDDLPFMARDLLDEKYGVVHMTTQRGCPFPCTYCAAGQFHQLYGSNSEYGRRRSHDSVLSELATIREQGELNYVIFLDDTFTIFPSWVSRFCEEYAREFGVPFSIHARVDTVDSQMIESLAAAGCRHIVYGVESGSYRLRKEVMKRPITNERMIDAFDLTKRSGIITTANYMLGLPFETQDDLEETFTLHARLDPDDFGYFVFYPFPGTALYRVCEDNGFLPENYLSLPCVHRDSILKLPDLTREQIRCAYDRFTEIRINKQISRLNESASSQTVDEIRDQTSRCAALG
jgi:radical SAM superfamily enzyme YgiQ (UPF0313 family)